MVLHTKHQGIVYPSESQRTPRKTENTVEKTQNTKEFLWLEETKENQNTKKMEDPDRRFPAKRGPGNLTPKIHKMSLACFPLLILVDLRWAKSRESYRRITSESYRRDSNH